MEARTITLDRFEALLAAYGAEPAHWPEEERSAAEALLLASSRARTLRDAERGLDGLLDALPQPEPASARLRMAVLQEATAARNTPALTRWLQALGDIVADGVGALSGRRLAPAGMALGASLCLGLAFGGFVAPSGGNQHNVDIVELALLNDTFTGY